ncbi:hypothetical protein FXO38_31484 [Capsicum annuum]|nr:hypothetical protein FXO38_31484 [Capsicum annuum]KAF3671294.1 hypothetical protein FXO37_08120 [Capsicum annuum]
MRREVASETEAVTFAGDVKKSGGSSGSATGLSANLRVFLSQVEEGIYKPERTNSCQQIESPDSKPTATKIPLNPWLVISPPPLPPLADLERKPEMPSRRVISTGAKGKKRSEVVTGDIGYTPRQGFKWKGKSVITNSKLEKMRTEKVIQTRSAAAAKSQGKNISTRKTHVL